MRKEISDLTARVATLAQKVDAEVATSNALKSALNTAIAGQLSAEEIAALDTAQASIAESIQKLADSAAVNAPSN